jgi:alpha-L-arabinofuranosidase
MAVNLRGAGTVDSNATALVLTGDPKGQNTAEEPSKIAPKQEATSGASSSFRRTFPAHSFTVLRLVAAPQ